MNEIKEVVFKFANESKKFEEFLYNISATTNKISLTKIRYELIFVHECV